MRITVTSGTKPLDPYPYTAGVLRRCSQLQDYKAFPDKRNHYVDRSQWQITENVHEPIIDRADFETAQRILENAPVRRPNGDGEIHPLSGLLFCKDCGRKNAHPHRLQKRRQAARCLLQRVHKGKAKNPKCHSPHIIDADLAHADRRGVLKKIEDYSISNRAEFEALVKKNSCHAADDRPDQKAARSVSHKSRRALNRSTRC